MFGKMNSEEIDTLLHKQLVGYIGCHADGLTYVVPVSYMYDGKHVYVHSHEGMKLDVMRKNPKVCFQVDDTRDLANWQCAICQGEFEELEDDAAKREAFQKLRSRVLPIVTSQTMHLSADWPFYAGKDEPLEGIYFRIAIQDMTGRFEKEDRSDYFAT